MARPPTSQRFRLSGVLRGMVQLGGLFLLVAVVYRRLVSDSDDPFKCRALLHEGRWIDPPPHDKNPPYLQNWQPEGCPLHNYNARDISNCVGKQQILFVGDSNVRQIYWSAAKKLDSGHAQNEKYHADKEANLNYTRNNVNLRFLWDPFLNSSELDNSLRAYRESTAPASTNEEIGENAPAMVLIGGGLAFARHFDGLATVKYRESLERIHKIAYPTKAVEDLKVSSASGIEGTGDQVFFAPVEKPIYEKLSPSRAITIIPTKIDPMDKILGQLGNEQAANILWGYSQMTAGYVEAYEESGLHVLESVANRRADVLFNAACNAKNARAVGAPFDRTCCMNYSPLFWPQMIVLGFALLMLPIMGIKALKAKREQQSGQERFSKSVFALSLALCYCYYADRTHLLGQIQHLYSKTDFNVLCGITFLLGLLSMRLSSDSSSTSTADDCQAPKDLPFLPREQADEWKGWMQALALIYLYTGASRELWIYQIVRLTVTSYLFLTGYGHTMYFYRTRDYSIRRVVAVLLRLNLLSCSLAYLMQRTYLSYYVAPLASFWFLVVYLTMRIGHARNDYLPFLLGKILLAAILVFLLAHIGGLLELIVKVLRITCRIDWNANTARASLSEDQFIVLMGMAIAIANVEVSKALSSPLSTRDKLTSLVQEYYELGQSAVIALSAIIIPVFWLLTRRSPDRADYDWWLPVIAWLPVLSFPVVRSSTRWLRSRHLAVFAFLGRFSMETFILSHHLWLSGDGLNLLSTGLFKSTGSFATGQWKDFIVLTPIFLLLGWSVKQATMEIVEWFLGPNEESRWESETGRRKSNDYQLMGYTNGAVTPHHSRMSSGVLPKSKWSRMMPTTLKGRSIAILLALWMMNMAYIR